jgi:hypothetical protein
MSQAPQQPGYPPQTFPPRHDYPQGYPPPAGTAWAPPPRTGMGCGAKLLIFLGLLFLLLILVCCGGLFGVALWMKSSLTDSPEAVKLATDEIASIDVPAGLEPAGAASLHVPISGQLFAVFAAYSDKADHKSTLMLAAFGKVLDAQTQGRIRQAFEESLGREDSKGEGREPLLDRKEFQKRRVIRGEEAVFTVTKGIGAESKKPRIEVEGTFQGRTGTAMLILQADADRLPEQKVLDMLDSIE